MRLSPAFGAIILLTLAALPAEAQQKTRADQLARIGGGQVIGTIENITPNEVEVVNNITKKSEKIPVNAIETIRFHDEPAAMNVMRQAVRSGNYRAAVSQLNTLEAADISNARVKEDLAYYRALVNAKQALTSGGLEELQKAGTDLSQYVTQNPNTWHLYEAVEVIGDLYVAVAAASSDATKKNAYEMADKEYQKLAAAPWDDYKLRAAIARGRAFQRAGQFKEAKQHYEDAVRLGTGKGKGSDALAPLVLSARVGLADVTAETNPAEAIKMISEIIAGADPENTRLHAMAFLTLGKCHDKAKNPKEALLNFLKVDVLYFAQTDCHAESLYYLSRLWNEVNRPERAKEAAEKLRTRYPNSLFAGKLGK